MYYIKYKINRDRYYQSDVITSDTYPTTGRGDWTCLPGGPDSRALKTEYSPLTLLLAKQQPLPF